MSTLVSSFISATCDVTIKYAVLSARFGLICFEAFELTSRDHMVTLETGKSAIFEVTRKALSLEVWRLTFSCEKMPIHCAFVGYSCAPVTFRIPTVMKNQSAAAQEPSEKRRREWIPRIK